MKYIYTFSLSVLICTLSGCSILKNDLSSAKINVPVNYTGLVSDTSNIAQLKWRDYFKDPLLHELIDSALIASPDLNIVLQRIENARAQIKTAQGAQLPAVNAGINISARKFGFYTMDD
ncbi:MAG: TolC family protein, partial [Ferruginibacter sp.]|nr:TolC family protein [Ferruginibacter sp.]